MAGDAGDRHIAILAIDGSGAAVAYRKMWLGGEESARFSPGPASAVVEIGGWRLGLAVCKDTGVPGHADDTAALGIDAYVAGVLETADDAAVVEARALRVAAAHAVWVVIASFAGSKGGGYDRAAGEIGHLASGRVGRGEGRRDARRDRARHARGLTPGPIHRSNQAWVARIASSA